MPFTLSHAVVAPPLSKLTGHRLPIAALAIGCMVPDLIRLFSSSQDTHTHLWRALIQPDLWIGLAFALLWYALYRPVIYRFLGIRHDLALHSFSSAIRFFISISLAILLGTATHIIWDGLTHVDFRTFAFHDWLSQNITLFQHSYPLHRILQIGSSILALPIIGWMCRQYYRQYRNGISVSLKIKIFALTLLLLSLLVGALSTWDYARYFAPDIWRSELYFFIGKSINEFTQAALPVFTLGCLLFLFLDRGHRLN